MTSRVASFRSSGSSVNSFLLNSARNPVTTSEARLPSRIVRLAVSRAPSTFGGSAASIRRQVLALVMMPERGWLTSWAIEAVNALKVVTRATCASSERALFRASSATMLLGHVLNGADEHRSTRDFLHDMADAAQMLHVRRRGDDAKRKSKSTPSMARVDHGLVCGRSSGWMMSPNRLHRDFSSRVRTRRCGRPLGPVGWSPTKSVMKLPVLLSRWASANDSCRRSPASARFRSSMSTIWPYHCAIRPSVSRKGSPTELNPSILTVRAPELVDIVVRRARCGRMQPTSHGRVPLVRDERVRATAHRDRLSAVWPRYSTAL